jgi:hypothetical protein
MSPASYWHSLAGAEVAEAVEDPPEMPRPWLKASAAACPLNAVKSQYESSIAEVKEGLLTSGALSRALTFRHSISRGFAFTLKLAANKIRNDSNIQS